MSIASNKFVACTYELYVGGEEKPELMEKATTERPLEYIHGLNMMLPDFEKNLFGLSAGDKFDFVLTPEQAYGEYSEEHILDLPKTIFTNEEGVFDAEQVVVGNVLPMQTQDGHTVQGLVKEISEEVVKMDFNHPLAGETLHFKGEILSERDATEEDMSKFFGGGCSGDCCCGSHGEDECCGSHEGKGKHKHGEDECCGKHEGKHKHSKGECCGHK